MSATETNLVCRPSPGARQPRRVVATPNLFRVGGWLDAAATVMLAALTLAMLGLAAAQPSTRITEPSAAATNERAAAGTVVAFSDFACPFCGWFLDQGAGR